MPRAVHLVPLLWLLAACHDVPFGWSPEVDALVDRLIDEHRAELAGPIDERPIVVFDFDNTTIQGDLTYEAVRHIARTGRMGFDVRRPTVFLPSDTVLLLLTWRPSLTAESLARLVRQTGFKLFERYLWLEKEGDKLVALTFLARLFSGFTPEALQAFAREAWELGQAGPVCVTRFEPEGLQGEPFELRTGVRSRPGVRWMMDRLRAAGFQIWIVSASPKPIVEVGAAAYGVPADHVIGTRLKLDADGRLGTEVEPPIPWRAGKLEAIDFQIKHKAALVFGDSWTDFEMLTNADHGVLLQTAHATGGDVAAAPSDLEKALLEKGSVLLQPPLKSDVPWAPCAPTAGQ